MRIKKTLILLWLGLCCWQAALAKDIVFTAIGDQPYFDESAFEKLISKINADQQSQLTIHVGDIKSGSTTCTDERFLRVQQLFATFQKPFIYTPGDNEWTDCHRISNGSYEPTERLAKIRELFFKTKFSHGITYQALERQGDIHSQYAMYIENVRWWQDDVLFVTLHQVGSNNNLDPKIPGAITEYTARNRANLAWLQESFAIASKKEAAAIVLAMQADTFDQWIPKESGFTDFLTVFGNEAQQFKKPILVIQGDSHQYKVDQAFKNNEQQTIRHVIRLIVPGANLVEAVQVTIKPKEQNIDQFFVFKKY